MKVAFSGCEADLDQEFANRLSDCSELELIMFSTIAIEHEIDRFILAILPNPKFFQGADLDFHTKGKLALALGLGTEFQSPLKFIGNIRNEFAHKWEAKLQPWDADNFVATFSKEHRKDAEFLYSKLNAAGKLRALREPYDNLIPSDRYLLSAVVLRMGIRATRMNVEKLKPIAQEFLAANPHCTRV